MWDCWIIFLNQLWFVSMFKSICLHAWLLASGSPSLTRVRAGCCRLHIKSEAWLIYPAEQSLWKIPMVFCFSQVQGCLYIRSSWFWTLHLIPSTTNAVQYDVYMTRCIRIYMVDSSMSISMEHTKIVDLEYGFLQGFCVGTLEFKLYTKPLTKIAHLHGISIHLYAWWHSISSSQPSFLKKVRVP